MRSSELADAVSQVVAEAQERILGTGNDQYSQGDTQLFETLETEKLYDWLKEELLDVVNYSTMLILRIEKAKALLDDQSSQK